MSRLKVLLLLVLAIIGRISAWKAPMLSNFKSKSAATVSETRQVIRTVVGSLITGSVLLGSAGNINIIPLTGSVIGVAPAVAAVGEGGLPDGIIAFQKLVKFQKDLDGVAKSAKERGSEMDNMEIQTLKIFMKQLANEYGDMEFLSRSINSEKDREAAKQIGKDLRIVAREVDKALSDGKVEVLSEKYPEMKKMVSDFLDYLSDVPDEL